MDTAAAEHAREYYRALDDHDYEAFEALLAPGFVHERPDRTLDGRERFVRFMREERPNRNTRHRVDAVYHGGSDGDGDATAGNAMTGDSDATAGDGRDSVAVEGRLLDSDGTLLMEFVDVFGVVDGRIDRVDTYART